MTKLLKTIINDIKKNKSLYIGLILSIVISILFGTFFISILEKNDRVLVTNEITTFLDNIKNNNYIANKNLLSNILNNNIFGIIIWILGISMIGIPLIICMLFYKGFSLAFTITSILYSFKFDGIVLTFIYIFPHLIINLIIYFILTYYSLMLSINLIKHLINKEDIKFKNFIKKYLIILILSIIILTLTAIYETYVIPQIIKLIY